MLFWLPEVASSYGADIDRIFYIILVITGIAFILTEGCLLWFAVKYRHREGRRAHYTHGNKTLEVIWTAVPTVILVVLTLLSKQAWDEIHQKMPPGDVNVLITASQFNWEVRYAGRDTRMETEDDVVLNNEMHVPVDRKIRIALRSKDVIHSFFLPHMRVKQDAVPGLTIPVWFEPIKTGDFQIACAELCGFGHTTMYGVLTVHTLEEYRTWLDQAEQEAAPQEPSAGPSSLPGDAAPETIARDGEIRR